MSPHLSQLTPEYVLAYCFSTRNLESVFSENVTIFILSAKWDKFSV
ncbi:hypothetical protein LMxysn_1542 [Listeria monocytogenes]|nr:hypothetical protein LMxysn_1542 [Listeria monocytogenes]